MKQINFKFNICKVFFPTFFCHLLICNIFFTAMKQINFKFSICNISFRKYSDFTIKCLRKKRVFQKRRYFGAPKNERKKPMTEWMKYFFHFAPEHISSTWVKRCVRINLDFLDRKKAKNDFDRPKAFSSYRRNMFWQITEKQIFHWLSVDFLLSSRRFGSNIVTLVPRSV